MENLIIVGGGGFAKEVIWLAEETNKFNILGILDDNQTPGSIFYGKPILGSINTANLYQDAHFVIAIGNPRTRKLVHERLTNLNIIKFPNLLHPSVIKSSTVQIGVGNIICAGTVITTEINIGDFNIINLNCTIGHDTSIANFCTIAPLAAISGNVHLAELVEIGTGASVRQGLTIQQGGMLGMGGVLTKNIEQNQIFVGNPAAFFKSFS